ncbi:helix-turn-helix transcriptional regulator [Actinoplanes sp. NPDC026619]|uniref:helix-turn-helix domain-containing protein n=1 Tax=Actinoplanes sp. NPDC026619 TaxID=3155798 RepID=UPI0033EBF5A0
MGFGQSLAESGSLVTNQTSHTFRQALRSLRSSRELSQQQLGRLVNYSGAYISDLELGRKPIHAELAAALDAALGAGGSLLAAAERNIAEPLDQPWTKEIASTALSGVAESALMDRRNFLVLTSTTAANLANAWHDAPIEPLAVNGGGRVTQEVVDRLQARVQELWHLDDLIGGGGCLDTAVSDLRLTNRLINRGRYSEPVGKRLFSLAAALARFCGFVAFDAGRGAAAQRFWHAGLRAAAAAGDTDQGIYILSNLALQAIYEGDGQTAVQMLDVAKDRVDPSAKTVLSMLDCWAVRAHSVSGDKRAAAHVLNRADDLWARRHMADDPSWVYWMPQPSLTAEAGTALMEIGDLPAAERSLIAGMATLDEGSAREKSLYLTRIAEVQLLDSRLDEAIVTAHGAIDAADGVDSARVRAQLGRLIDRLPANEPAVAELLIHRSEGTFA